MKTKIMREEREIEMIAIMDKKINEQPTELEIREQ